MENIRAWLEGSWTGREAGIRWTGPHDWATGLRNKELEERKVGYGLRKLDYWTEKKTGPGLITGSWESGLQNGIYGQRVWKSTAGDNKTGLQKKALYLGLPKGTMDMRSRNRGQHSWAALTGLCIWITGLDSTNTWSPRLTNKIVMFNDRGQHSWAGLFGQCKWAGSNSVYETEYNDRHGTWDPRRKSVAIMKTWKIVTFILVFYYLYFMDFVWLRYGATMDIT